MSTKSLSKVYYNLYRYIEILDDSNKDISYEPFTKSRSASPVVKSNHSTSSFMTQKTINHCLILILKSCKKILQVNKYCKQ